VPFLRLTRDRRGIEYTFLLHAGQPGEAPRILYWYRTAPGVLIGRPALDEEAIRTIEEQHPEIDFDWPVILALREAMPPEEEERQGRPRRARLSRREAAVAEPPEDAAVDAPAEGGAPIADAEAPPEPETPTTHGLLEELVGREIATRLRARYAEVMARIHEQRFDEATLEGWTRRADALDPDTWLTPDAILAGVRDADRQFEALRADLFKHRTR
jgi:hypothetical protein